MAEHGTAHLVVVDPELGDPLGVLSTLDLARIMAEPPLEPTRAAA